MDGQLSRENPNPFAVAGREAGGLTERSMLDVDVARGVAEIQGAMVVAKKFPRDQMAAYNRIMRTCERYTLAERALYNYPKGDKTVRGPSIRLAEAIAQNWGNIRFAIDEVEQHEGYSIVKAYAWDIETNTFVSKTFTVNHEIMLKGGKKKALTDPREIYELCANMGARRMRACILAVIPGDVVEAATDRCKETILKKEKGVPIIDRIRKMSAAFEKLGVTTAMLEGRFRHKVEVISEEELIELRGIYTALTDGEGRIEQYFDRAPAGGEAPKDLEKKQPEETSGAATEPKTAEPPKEPANQTSEAATAQTPPATSDAPADSTKAKGRKAKTKEEEPAKAAAQPTAQNQTAAKPADPASFPRWFERLKNVMALSTCSDNDIIEYCVRAQNAPGVATLEELGDAAHKWLFENWEGVEANINAFKTANSANSSQS